MRGEHPEPVVKEIRRPGSSPRARGARRTKRGGVRWRGIIPACAGSTNLVPRSRFEGRDHPRVRGEHPHRLTPGGRASGSSPRARGAPDGVTEPVTEIGIIPACAGSTEYQRTDAFLHGDHPRVRGEHGLATSSTTWVRGSSPRARGAPTDREHRGFTAGIIPACAGSTTPAPGAAAPVGDHPRVRGEHKHALSEGRSMRGSSPRARGALHVP